MEFDENNTTCCLQVSGIMLILLLLLLFVVHTKKGAIKQKLKDESERERLHTRKMSDEKFKG